jgi:ribose-phosphate pyrophosphokinase
VRADQRQPDGNSVLTDALKRPRPAASAWFPFGYARQTAAALGACRSPRRWSRICDHGWRRPRDGDGPHADQIQGFFNIPVDNIYATPILLGDLWKQNYDDLLVVSPDVGGVVRARAIAKRLDSDLAIIDKRRPRANVSEVMNIIGDVDGRTCVIMDDIVDTANTLCKAATALKEHGAKKVVAYCASGAVLAARSRGSPPPSWTRSSSPTRSRCPTRRTACPRIRQLSVRAAARGDDDSSAERGVGEPAVHLNSRSSRTALPACLRPIRRFTWHWR